MSQSPPAGLPLSGKQTQPISFLEYFDPFLNYNFTSLIISGLTGGHNTDSPSKEKAVLYDLELLYSGKGLGHLATERPL